MELAKAISAILFYQAEPITIARLATLLKATEGDVSEALTALRGKLADTGLQLIQNGDAVTLGTGVEASALIEHITKEELSKDLSKAALETLAIVLYKGPITRSEIDYIRGVNSTFILRNLLVRGLVEKVENPKDQRSFLYKSTFQLLEYMGVGSIDALPEYHDTLAALNTFVAALPEEKENKGEDSVTASVAVENDLEILAVAEAMENTAATEDLEADIREEDEAGEGYDDEALRTHPSTDQPSQTP